MTNRRAFERMILTLGIAFAAPLAAGAQPAPGSPQSVLGPLTERYFAAVAANDGRALAAATSNTFHVVLPGGERLSAEAFFQRLSAHYLISTIPRGTVKIGPSSISGTTATETVMTNMWDEAMVGSRHDPILERDFVTHQLTWIKSPDGTWLLDEDHFTSADHMP